MKTPPPVGTTLYKIVGSNISTLARVWLDSAGQPIDWIEANGDGVVTEHSASNGDWLGTFPAIEVHADIFRDEHVQVLLKRLLTKDTSLSEFSALVDQLQAAPRHESLLRASKAPVYGYTGSGGSSKAIETMGGSVALHSLKIETARSYLSPAEPSWVRLRLLSPGPNALVPSRNAEPIAGVTVIGIIRSGTAEESAETSVDVHEVEPGVYEAPFVAPATPGTYRLALLVPGIGEIAETIVVRSDTSELDAPSAK